MKNQNKTQNRDTVRINVNLRELSVHNIWIHTANTRFENTNLGPKPSLVHITEDIQVENISANGILINIDSYNKKLQKIVELFNAENFLENVPKGLICSFDLKFKLKNNFEYLAISGKLVRIHEQSEHDYFIAIQFLKWSNVATTFLTWIPVQNSFVPSINKWVTEQQLKYIRLNTENI